MQEICNSDSTVGEILFLRKMDGQGGLTLIEVMMALTIFTIGILAVAGMQGVSMKVIGKAHWQTRQSVSAASRIEEILTKPYDHPLLIDSDKGYEPGVPDHGPYAMDGGPYTIAWEVDDDFPVQDTKRITVTVRPISKSGPVAPSIFEYVKAREY